MTRATITPTTKRRVPFDFAQDDVRIVVAQTGTFAHRVEIRDGTAIALAQVFESAGYERFANLAIGEPFDLDDLLDEIAVVRQQHGPDMAAVDLNALDCLATWAINHPNRRPA